MVVQKFKLDNLPFGEEFSLSLPKCSQVIDFKFQDDIPTIWVYLDEYYEKENRRFIMLMTGQENNRRSEYIATAITKDDKFVLHLFEIK